MRRACTIHECAASVAMIGVLIALGVAVLSENRRHARLGEDIASLKRFGAATGAYAADNADAIWGFTWKGGEVYLMMDLNGDLVPTQMPAGDVAAGARQAVHLIRSIGGRIGEEHGMPVVNNWLPHVDYSHLPLFEYLDEDPLAGWTTSAADDVKQRWKDDPINKFDNGLWLPQQPDPTPINRRWPYSSGFELSPAAWDFNQSELDDEFEGTRIQQAGQHTFYTVPGSARVSGRVLSDVTYPGGKAQMYDTHQRHFGDRVHYFAVANGADGGPAPARLPMLVYDASASIRAVAESNPGWRPNTPTFPCMTFWYSPNSWEPATTNGEDLQFCKGVMRWTRGGLKGLDFGGRPLDTNQGNPGECDL